MIRKHRVLYKEKTAELLSIFSFSHAFQYAPCRLNLNALHYSLHQTPKIDAAKTSFAVSTYRRPPTMMVPFTSRVLPLLLLLSCFTEELLLTSR